MELHLTNMRTIEYIFEVLREQINYIRIIVESYDGMAFVKTIDPHEALISILIAPGCEDLILELLGELMNNEDILIINRSLS